MEARIRRLWNRKFSPSSSSQSTTGHSYDLAIPQQPPIKGSFPVQGNGQANLQDQILYGRVAAREKKRQSQISSYSEATSAAPPDIPRSLQWDADADVHHSHFTQRPQTASTADSLFKRSRSKHSGRTFSGFSMKGPPSFKQKRRNPSTSTIKTIEAFKPDAHVPPVPQRPSHIRNQSSHVDIIAASSLRHHASGRRDYGEDVADRNMGIDTKQAPESNFNFNSPEFSYMRLMYLREKGAADRSRDHSRAGSARHHLLKEDYDPQAPQNGTKESPHTLSDNPSLASHPIVTRISSDGRPSKVDRSKSTRNPPSTDDQFSDAILVSTTRKTISTYQPTGTPNPVPSYPYPSPGKKPPVPARSEARPLSIASNCSRSKASNMRETMREVSSSSKRIPSNPSRSIDHVGAGAGATAAAVAAATGNENSRSRAGSEAGTKTWPLLASRSVLEKKLPHLPTEQQHTMGATNSKPLTPPMSPDPPGTTSAPIIPSKNSNISPAKPVPTTRSRANSASYSPFPKTGSTQPSKSRQGSEVSSYTLSSDLNATTNANPTNNDSRSRIGNAQNRAGLAVDGASLNGIVDLSNTVDTSVSEHVLPAVTHETITPQVHNIREERITREIHTHDVFHRILPIVDVEILPTKHYVRNNAGGLTEIPAPGRQERWRIEESPRTSTTSLTSATSTSADSVAPPAIPVSRGPRSSISTQQKSATFSDQPVMTSTRTSTMSSGGIRTESVWRHAPEWEESSGRETRRETRQETRQTAPLRLNKYDGAVDHYDTESESSRSRRSEDSGFLFRETGYGGGGMLGGGMLPGLTEQSPTADTASALSREKAELRRRVEGMNLK